MKQNQYLCKHEKAQGMVEYALIIVLVAVVMIIITGLVGSQVSTVFSQVISGLSLTDSPGPQESTQTFDEWTQACYDRLNTVIDGRTITHVRVDEFIHEGRQAYQCLVIYDSSRVSERIGDIFYP